MKKIIFIIIIFLFSTDAFSQNIFRSYINIVNSSSNPQFAYNECINYFKNPTVTISKDNKITAYSFNSGEGRVIFGKNNTTKKIEGVLIVIQDDIERSWVEDIVNAYFYEDESGVLRNRYNNLETIVWNDAGGIKMVGIGNESIFSNIPIKL